MKKDSKYELLEDRITQLEDIIDELIAEIPNTVDKEDPVVVFPFDIIKKIEKSLKGNINIVGIS